MNSNTRLYQNEWITDPTVADPENLPQPLGWTLLVRPYPIKMNETKTSLIMPDSEMNHMNYVNCIGRVVAIGPCCFNKDSHKDRDGNQFDWVEVGDFVAWPRHSGGKQKVKGVSYIVLNDDEIFQKLPDPQILDDEESFYMVDIPQEDLEKYNTIYKKG